MAKYKLVDLILERKDFIIKLSDGNDFIESFYDEKAVKSKYPISKVVNSATVIDITTPSGTSIISDKDKMTEVIGAFGEKAKKKLSFLTISRKRPKTFLRFSLPVTLQTPSRLTQYSRK